MKQKVKKNKKKKEDIMAIKAGSGIMLLVFVMICGFIILPKITLAVEKIDCPVCDGLVDEAKKECEKKRDECKKLEKKSKTYEKIVKLKQKEGSVLSQKISSLNSEINKTNENIEEKENKIRSIDEQVKNLEKKIKLAEKNIVVQRKFLVDILQAYYENKNQLTTKIVLGNNALTSVFLGKDYLGQVGKKITETTANLKASQENLNKQKKDLAVKKKKHIETQKELLEEKGDLLSVKSQKRIVLIQTQGDEARYKRRLEKIEKQKKEILGDIDALFNANYTELEAMVEKAPSKYWASTNWYYSQRDSRWKNKNIGNSNSKMKDYGCAVSAVAMVFTYHGKQITPGTLRKKSIFYWDIIKWPGLWGDIKLISGTRGIRGLRHGSISSKDWKTIDANIKNGNPVIIFIDAKNGAGHYVVIHHKTSSGKYVVHDPYFGSNIYLNSTFKLLSKMYKVSVSKRSVDQMILYK